MRPLLVPALLLAAAPAAAQAPTPTPAAPAATPPSRPAVQDPRMQARGRELMAACRTDIRAYCAKVEPGGGRILQCFRQNADKLTPACLATLKSLRGAGAPATPTAG